MQLQGESNGATSLQLPQCGTEYILRRNGNATRRPKGKMLDHLLDFDPEVIPTTQAPAPAERATPTETLDAKIKTADWLKTMGAEDTEKVVEEAEKRQARETFVSLTTAAPLKTQHELVTKLETPQAVRHLVGMLTAYDWQFIEQAQQIRGYAVAKLLEECEHTNANIRLKALGLLGKVTEVGLFTDKIEVKKTDMSDDEIESRIKEKLNRFMGVIDIVDVDEAGNTEKPDAN